MAGLLVRSGFIAALLNVLASGANADSSILRECLRGSKNPTEVAASKAACTSYLAALMGPIRFGVVTPHVIARPFCVPDRDLTDEEHKAIFSRFNADNPGLKFENAVELTVIISLKAHPCGKP